MKDEDLLRQIARTNWLVLVVFVLISFWWQSRSVTLGVVAGGLLVIANFGWMGRSLGRVLGNPDSYSPKGFKRNYLFRLLVVASALFLLLVRFGVHPFALVCGLSVVVVSLLITTLRRIY